MTNSIPRAIQPLGQCSGCGGLLFANVFHVCPSNMHLYQGAIPQAELDKLVAGSYVPPPPAANDSGVISEPPQLAHKEGRTHCEACREPIDPTVYHQCHGNQEYQPPAISSTEITTKCPACKTGEGNLHEVRAGAFVVVCGTCRAYVYPELGTTRAIAIYNWNASPEGTYPKWLAMLPGESEHQVSMSMQPGLKAADLSGMPSLKDYQGVCPQCHGAPTPPDQQAEPCDACGGKGVIP